MQMKGFEPLYPPHCSARVEILSSQASLADFRAEAQRKKSVWIHWSLAHPARFKLMRTWVLFLTDWVSTDRGPVLNSSSSRFWSSSGVISDLGLIYLWKPLAADNGSLCAVEKEFASGLGFWGCAERSFWHGEVDASPITPSRLNSRLLMLNEDLWKKRSEVFKSSILKRWKPHVKSSEAPLSRAERVAELAERRCADSKRGRATDLDSGTTNAHDQLSASYLQQVEHHVEGRGACQKAFEPGMKSCHSE
ncbi:hypothetical protein EYF80_019978 [Liparis tanakae]|uniref:Uncharacterized protein n=1 Tax=Liparis tanakae TaxID=230148 RepID=A0A4Z2HV73_9TELE|nr:hypothetical protein EYF80_019978 [Liparis tanakae]